MKTVFKQLVFLLIPLLVNSSEETTNSWFLKDIKEKELQCGAFCYHVVEPLVNYTVSIRSKEAQFADLQRKISEQQATIVNKESQLIKQIELTASKDALIANLQSQIKSKESQIGEKDKQINNLQSQQKDYELNINEKVGEVSKVKSVIKDKDVEIANIASLKETIKQQELQLNQQIELTASKDAFIANLQSQIKSKESQIGEKDKEISSLQSQQKDYELNVVKNYQLESRLTECKDMCLASSCLRKLTDIYTIKVPDIEPFSVPCDSNLAGNGWTVFQRRMDGSEDFYRTWDEYKAGFGDLRSEFFLGLEKLHLLTKSQPHELYIHLEDFESETRYAQYSHFVIGNEEEAYEIKKLGDYSGNAGDSMEKHLNMKFTTKDRDNDKSESKNCATSFESGWWFNNCYWCNLNGRYTSKDVGLKGKKISWNHWHNKPLKFTQMMIRPKST